MRESTTSRCKTGDQFTSRRTVILAVYPELDILDFMSRGKAEYQELHQGRDQQDEAVVRVTPNRQKLFDN
ncbi:MAG: hypothetical protein JRI65_14550 [Deltaproteobacteria bacterium]|nr:hypothetical protein [Deltaproteobacteria bacterium]